MLKDRITLAFHAFIRTLLILGFSLLITDLVRSDQLHLFIAPRMIWLVKLSAIGLYAIGMFQGYAALRHLFTEAPACDCDHKPRGSLIKHSSIYGLFALPLLLGVLLPNTTMGSALAAKKGMNLSAAASSGITALPEREETLETSQPLDVSDAYPESFARLAQSLAKQDVIQVTDEWFMEILTAVDLYADDFEGKSIEITGFVYRDDTLAANQFVIGRFAMDCCSADALPYGVLVEYEKAGRYQNDTWLTIRGTIATTRYQEQSVMVIRPERIARSPQPESPYVYPNYSF